MQAISRRERILREKAQKRQTIRQSEAYYVMSQWQLIKLRFGRNVLAVTGLITLCVIYFIALFCEFLAPYDPSVVQPKRLNLPPQAIHFISQEGFTLRPFVYGLKQGYERSPSRPSMR